MCQRDGPSGLDGSVEAVCAPSTTATTQFVRCVNELCAGRPLRSRRAGLGWWWFRRDALLIWFGRIRYGKLRLLIGGWVSLAVGT